MSPSSEEIELLDLHPSMKTKMSSAPIPKTMKTVIACKAPTYVTFSTPSQMVWLIGKLKIMSDIPVAARKIDFK